MEAVFLKVLNMSLSAALVIAVVLLVRLLLRRAPKKWSYLLWLVVAFRLCCPVSFSAPFSVLRLTAQPAVTQPTGAQTAVVPASEIAYIPQDIARTAEPRVYVATPRVSEVISQSLPAPEPVASVNPLQVWIAVGTALWCAGIAALLLYGVLSYLRLRRRLTGAVLLESGVRETDSVRSPFILGLVRPTVYLPVGIEGETLRYVLAHERFHIRHGDHAVKLIAFLLLTVHWFNPLVWLAFALMCRDMEMRCDEAVLSKESGVTKPYSMALLSFATQRRFPSPSPLCFGETGVKERIKNVLRWKNPKTWVTVAAALLCAVAVAACAVNPGKAEKENAPTSTPYDWTSTVQLSDIKGFAEGSGLTLTHSQMKELVALLNAVQPGEVVRGRGIPSVRTLDIDSGVGYKLRWGGGVIEMDFNDAAAAAELYGSPETPGPGVWEIRNQALYDFLDGLEAAPPVSDSDLREDAAPLEADWGEGYAPDGHMPVRRYDGDGWFIYIPVNGWTLTEASEERTQWTADSDSGSRLTVRKIGYAERDAVSRHAYPVQGVSETVFPAGDAEYWCVTTRYDPKIQIFSSWIASEPELLKHMAESFRTTAAAEAAAALMTVSRGYYYQGIVPYMMARFMEGYVQNGWRVADGRPLSAALEHANEIPELRLYADGIALDYAINVIDVGPLRVYDDTFSALLIEDADNARLSELAPGEYYCVQTLTEYGRYIEALQCYERIGTDCIFRLSVGDPSFPSSVAALEKLRSGDPERYTELMKGWGAEINMIGESFVSELGEAGDWQDVPVAFAERWCEKYLNAGKDSPNACYQAGVYELMDYLYAVTLTSTPRRLTFDVSLSLAPLDEEAFVFARMGWATRLPSGRVRIQTNAVLESEDGVHWTVTTLVTDGTGAWGWRNLKDDNALTNIRYALENDEPMILLRFLPNLDWNELTAEESEAAMRMLQEAAVADGSGTLGENVQLYRDLYMLWGFKRSDGAYAEFFIDGPESILAAQYRADTKTFLTALAEMDANTQVRVRSVIRSWQQ